ncbi:hypothetical protein MHYP_G00018050 [Metynnis hypsauchen]
MDGAEAGAPGSRGGASSLSVVLQFHQRGEQDVLSSAGWSCSAEEKADVLLQVISCSCCPLSFSTRINNHIRIWPREDLYPDGTGHFQGDTSTIYRARSITERILETFTT